MKYALYGIVAVVAAVAIWLGVVLIDVEQTAETQLPEVDINVEPGQMPAFEAEVGSIELTEQDVEVTVPEVEIGTTQEIVTLPDIEINRPDEAEDAEVVAESDQ